MARKIARLKKSPTKIHSNNLNKGDLVFIFDGDCSACNRWVRYVTKMNVKGNIYFSIQSSPFGCALKGAHPKATFLLKNYNGVEADSDALIKLIASIVWPLKGLLLLTLIPRKWRDRVVLLLAGWAKNRVRRFSNCGRVETAVEGRMLWE